ncbi:hypothetical protein SAMN02949497_1933 [Methylomagnum ishizawai]|uniref:Uncharacterized protein n=1 Tax=Methylomagnum ishizawai TaxID=1760988 RepID=A0A1Y6D234_9GAMM|nr:DUF6682 family protein [Methylomagnum ishizawai]SMF94612.1 hypothetical protein SAMN02949497_1933 [Methylomagnum ishizawai]
MAVTVVLDAAGFDPGPGIALTEMETLRAYRPDWPMDAPADRVENYMYDERKPTLFYVYPPATEDAHVEIVYVRNPTPCVGLDSGFALPDAYANAALYYMLMRAAEKAQRFDVARGFGEQYRAALQVRAVNDLRGSPNLRNQGGAGVPGLGG